MPSRILIDTRHVRDFGIGTYIRNLVRALASTDQCNEFVLVASREGTQEFTGLPANFRVVQYERSDTAAADQVAFPLFARRFGADLYHVPLSAVALTMPRPYVVTVHDMSSLMYSPEPGLWGKFRLYQFRRGLERAVRIIAVSDTTRQDIEDLFGVPSERVRRIYNAPDPRFLEPRTNGSTSEAQRILERYQIDYPFLLYTGSIRPQKNVPRLVEAFAVARGKFESHPVYKDLRLIIIGDEISKYPAVRRAVFHTRVEDVVRFLGFVPIDTLRVFYEAASAFVFPSMYEGFGLPPLEAMASGTPVVASNRSSLPEVVGDAALLVNPENVFDIARGIHDVLMDEALRAKLISRGHEQAKRFSWQSTAQQVLQVYEEVIREQNAQK